MPKADTKPAPLERTGSTEADPGLLAKVREWLLACDEARKAQQRKDDARAALDAAAGTYAAGMHGEERVFHYRPGTRRVMDLDRLQERWSEAYEDCARQSATSTLVVDDEYGRLLRTPRWRAALGRR